MSWNPLLDPSIPIGNAVDAIDTVIIARARDLGGFEVRRALPSARRQMVGPFIFFDQMGPAEFLTGQGVDVRPHPHIGLSTVTYLLQGQMHHRDSIGTNRQINVGEVAVMQSGIGITHSERSDNRDRPQPLFGLQTWLALADEDAAPSYHQTAALPTLSAHGIDLRLILGTAYGQSAPTPLQSETFYADVTLAPNAAFPLPEHEDRGIYILSGTVTEGAQTYDAGAMLIYRPGDQISVRAGGQGARLVALGGATMGGPRHLWWNFVASSRERIDAAREAWRAGDWAHGRFQLPPDDDAEFIPAPEK
jgi:redox-sensitive bicupin YhaK (pirin superfamily)